MPLDSSKRKRFNQKALCFCVIRCVVTWRKQINYPIGLECPSENTTINSINVIYCIIHNLIRLDVGKTVIALSVWLGMGSNEYNDQVCMGNAGTSQTPAPQP